MNASAYIRFSSGQRFSAVTVNTAVGQKDRERGEEGNKDGEGLKQGQRSKQPKRELREPCRTMPASGMVPLQSNTGSAGAPAVNQRQNVCLCVLSRVGLKAEEGGGKEKGVFDRNVSFCLQLNLKL